METVILEVNKQEMWKKNDPVLVADEVNFVRLKVTFDDSWDGLNRTYYFTNGTVSRKVESNIETIIIPHEVMIEGTLCVAVKGTKLAQDGTTIEVKPTVTPVEYEVLPSKINENAGNHVDPTPSDVEQIRQIAENAESIAQTVREDANEGEFTPHFSVGNVQSVEGPPEVNMTGTELDPVLNFNLQKGDKGDVNFFTFDIDVDTGQLIMYKTEQYTGNIDFSIDENGCLIEEMEVA